MTKKKGTSKSLALLPIDDLAIACGGAEAVHLYLRLAVVEEVDRGSLSPEQQGIGTSPS